jgi:hypothetical protein
LQAQEDTLTKEGRVDNLVIYFPQSSDSTYKEKRILPDTLPPHLVIVLPKYPIKRPIAPLDSMGGSVFELPFYDELDNEPAVIWRLSYFKPYYTPLERSPSELSLWQASQRAYILSTLYPMSVKKPFTEVRFDQSSRRTQLLRVDHAQNFSSRAGFRALYRRRTRTGEYLGQTTDHYGFGFLVYGETMPRSLAGTHLYGLSRVFWNQLYDEINGGSVFDSAQGLAGAFQKERQPVRFTDGQWRVWYRALEVESGIAWNGSKHFIGLQAQVRQTYGGWRGGPARVPMSPYGTDTISWNSFAFGEEQRIGLRAGSGYTHLSVHLLRWWGRGTGWQSFDQQALTAEAHLSPPATKGRYIPNLSFFYRYWFSPQSPPPELRSTFCISLPFATEFSLHYSRQALPWFFYRAYPLSQFQNTESLYASYAFSWRDSAVKMPPLLSSSICDAARLGYSFFQLSFWGLRQRWPLLLRGAQALQPEAPLFWYGIRLTGTWERRRVGVYPAILFQRAVGPDTLRWWVRQIPAVAGWVQVSYRWQIPPFAPIYRLGVRLRGSSAFVPPQYEPAYGLFLALDHTPLQPAWSAVDVFLTISLRQIHIYLRVDHLMEGLFQPGSFWTYPYPVPGRAFSFGFVWQLYN